MTFIDSLYTFTQIKKIILITFSCCIFYSCSSDDDAPPNLPPNNFSLVQIANNSNGISLKPKLSWTKTGDPNGDSVTYSILLDKGEGNPSIILVSDIQNTNYTLKTSLEYNTSYKWQVEALDDKGASTRSEIFSFITKTQEKENNTPPGGFDLLQVLNNENNVSITPQLIWGNSIDIDGDNIVYDLLLDMGNENPTTIIANDIEKTSFELVNSLNYNTTYSWKVIAYDSFGNNTSSTVFSFTTKEFQGTLATSNAKFSTRTEHGLIKFNNKLWVIGGYHAGGSANGGLLNDVWSSTDGTNWIEEVENTSSQSFTPRTNHTTVVFQNKVWVIAGGGVNSILNDVWSSLDGTNWKLETSNASFSKRRGHTTVVFNNRLWVIGGRDESSNYLNDVWSSSDGTNWKLETGNANFIPRGFHSNVVFQNKMWIIGGFGLPSGDLNDVWSSNDGIEWTIETVSADFTPRRGHSSTVYKNRIWVIAGDLKDDFWSSKNGINWKQESRIINFKGRGEQANSVYKDKLWVIGGWMGSLLNDVWFFD